MRIVYMVHPVRGTDGDVVGNLRKAKSNLRRLLEEYPDTCVVAPWITECEIFDDADPEQRSAGLRRCLGVIDVCDEVWVIGAFRGEGMELEIAHAHSCGIPVREVVSA